MSTRTKGRPTDVAEGEIKDRILKEAARLFAENGYAGTSVQEIVSAAGTTKPMVYYYFNGKQELYKALIEAAYNQVRGKLEKIDTSAGTLEERLVAAVEANFNLQRDSPELARFALAMTILPPKDAPDIDFQKLGEANFRITSKIIDAAVQAGEIRGNSAEIALALSGMIIVYIMAQYSRPELNLLGYEAAQRIVKLLLKGVEPR